jgi:hypothetical protein
MIMHNNLLFKFWTFFIVSFFRPNGSVSKVLSFEKCGDTGNFQSNIKFLFGTLKSMTFFVCSRGKVKDVPISFTMSVIFQTEILEKNETFMFHTYPYIL